MARFRILLGLALSLALTSLQAQSRGAQADIPKAPLFKGKTYAMVVGISDYGNELIKDLNFAESDARAFAGFLKAKSGGNVPAANIIELYGKDASSTKVWENGIGYYFLRKKMFKPGDRLILYFSGHGGSFNSADRDNAYYFVYDANSQTDGDTNLKISQVKDLIHTLVEEGIQVIFIFDACRSADVGVKGGIDNVNKIVEEPQGEVIITASRGGKVAYESHRLGHGVFTYYLLRGLYGEADEDHNGELKGTELEDYLRMKTKAYSRDEFKDEQIPFAIWGAGGAEDKPLFRYDSLEGKLAIASMELKAMDLKSKNSQLASNNKGFSKGPSKVKEDPMVLFDRALNANHVLRPENDCAYYYYEKIKASRPSEEVLTSLQTSLSIALIDVARRTINDDLMGKRNYMRKTMQFVADSLGESKAKSRSLEGFDADYYGIPLEALQKYSEITPEAARNPSVNSMSVYCEGRWSSITQTEVVQRKEILKKISAEIEAQPSKAYLYFVRGQVLSDLGELKEAIKNHKKAYQLSPNWTYPLVAVSNAFRSLQQYDSASYYISHFTSKSNSEDFLLPYLIGNSKSDFGLYDSATYYYRKSIKINPRHADAYFSIAYVKNTQKQSDSAIYYYNHYTDLKPTDPNAFNNLGVALDNLGKKEEAIKSYLKAIDLDPNFAIAYDNLGLVYYNLGKLDEAVTYYRKAVEINPDFAKAHYNIGRVQYDQRKYEEAITASRTAIRLNPRYAEAYNNIGLCQYYLLKYDEAIEAYKKTIEIRPDAFYAHNNLGLALYKKGKYDEAIVSYRKAIQYNPQYYQAFNNLGIVYNKQRNYDDAIINYKKAIEFNASYHLAYNNLGIALNNQGKTEEAMEAYRKSISINPNYADAVNNLGNAYYKLRKYHEAKAEYEKVIVIKPDADYGYHNIGLALKMLGKVEEAIPFYKKAIELNPKYSQANYNLGNALYDLDRTEEAIPYIQKAIELNPEYTDAFNLLGSCYYVLGNYSEALSAYLRVIELKPLADYGHYNLGNTLSRLGKQDDAIKSYQKTIELNPKYWQAFNGIGLCQLYEGKPEAAIVNFEKTISIHSKSSSVFVNLGSAYGLADKYADAARQFEKVLEFDANDRWSCYTLGGIYQADHQDEKAKVKLEKALTLSMAKEDRQLSALCQARLGKVVESKSVFDAEVAKNPTNSSTLYNYACFFAVTQQPTLALEWLEKSMVNGYNDWNNLAMDLDFKDMRKIGEFKSLVAKFKK